MNKIKTYKLFTESIKDKLKGKSDVEIKHAIDELNPLTIINYIERKRLSKEYLPDSKDIANYLKKENKWDISNRFKYIRKGYLSKEYKPTKEEIVNEIKKIKKWRTKLLLEIYKNVKNINNRELLHFLYDNDAFTVSWYSLEYILDEVLGNNNYNELYDMSLDDQIDFIENNTHLDIENLIEISIDQVERNDELFNKIKKNILEEIS